jgi:hypothetical protein
LVLLFCLLPLLLLWLLLELCIEFMLTDKYLI